MATEGMLAERAVTSDELRPEVRSEEAFADRVCAYSAMGGVVCGVIAGAFLGHSVATAYPDLFAGLGGMLGGIVAAVAGHCIFLPAWTAHERKQTQPTVNPILAYRNTPTPVVPESPLSADGTSHPDITASSPAGD